MTRDKLVYSTNQAERDSVNTSKNSRLIPSGPAKMRLESNGRGGKLVTVLFNLPFSESASRDLMRVLQQKLGCGGSYKDGNVELRGDVRDRVEAHFAELKLKIIRAGGR